MAITAAGTDTRSKAVATLSMYDMSRDMSRGHMDYYTEEQRMKIKQYLSEQRWRDTESGTYALGNHEIGFDEAGNPLTAAMEVPEELPEGADPAFTAFLQYYAKRARHPPRCELCVLLDGHHAGILLLIEKMRRIGSKYGASPAQVAAAWAIAKGTLPIIGVTKAEQVEAAAKAAEIVLTAEEVSELEALGDAANINTLREWEKEM